MFELLEVEAYQRGSERYEELRHGDRTSVPDRFPDFIARPVSEAQLATALRFAFERRLPVSVRSAGHAPEAPFLRDGGMLIDLGRFDRVSLNLATGVAQVEPAVRGGDLNGVLATHDLMLPVGRCPRAGIAGLLRYNAEGWNSRVWGRAAELVLGVDLVTACGRIERIDRDDPRALSTALVRRDGHVITRYRIATRALPGGLMTSEYRYPLGLADAVTGWLASVRRTFPPLLEVASVVSRVGRPAVVLSAAAFGDTLSESHDALASLETFPHVESALAKDVMKPVGVDGLAAICPLHPTDQLHEEETR